MYILRVFIPYNITKSTEIIGFFEKLKKAGGEKSSGKKGGKKGGENGEARDEAGVIRAERRRVRTEWREKF